MREQWVLQNGIRVVTEYQPYFQTCSLGIWVQLGSAHETKENQGISHLIEHMLFKGTKNRSAKEIARIIARLGDDINAFTSKEYTALYGTTLPELLPELAELFGDMLQNSLFDENDLIKEKAVIMEEIDMYNDSPEDLVHEKLQEAVWNPHPLSYIISGEKETVNRITRDELCEFMRQGYTADNLIISIAGNFAENTQQILELYFGKISGSKNVKITHTELTPAIYHREMVYIKRKIEQLHINLAFESFPAKHRLRFALAVLNSALGGSSDSLLFQTIREELGLAYSVYSYTGTYRMSGLFHIDITVNPKQACETIQKVFELLDKVRREGFRDEVLENYKKQVVIELIMGSESAKDKMSMNAKYVALYGTPKEADNTVEQVKLVTTEDVLECAKTLFDFSKASICMVGNPGSGQLTKIQNMFWECAQK